MQSKDARWKALVAAVKGKREATKYVALVELAQLCRERLQQDPFTETESSSRAEAVPSRLSSKATTSSQALFEALVECISVGDLKVVALGVKCLLKDYSRSSPCAVKGVRDILFECVSQTVSHNASANLKHTLMHLVTGIQYCYLVKGWTNTFVGNDREMIGKEEYPLLKVVRICGLQSMECRASVRFAVQMMFQNVSSTIDAVGNFAVAIDSAWVGSMESKKAEMKLEKVRRMLTHFVEIFLPTLMLRDALGGAANFEVGNTLVLYSLEQLRKLLQTKNMALFSKFVLQLVTGQFVKVLSLALDTFDTRTLDIVELLLDFVDSSHEEAAGETACELDLRLQSLLLQLSTSRVSQQKPLTDVIPLLCRLYSKKMYQGKRGLRSVQSFHLAYLAMQDAHLDSDTIVSLFSRTMHLGEHHGGQQPYCVKKAVEIVTLLSFANRIKIGQGSSTLISLNLLEELKRSDLPRDESESEESVFTPEEQNPFWSCYYQECRVPIMIQSILKCLNGSSKSPRDTLVYATSFLESLLSLKDTAAAAVTSADEKLVLCILQSLLSHQNMEVKHACVSSLRDICKALPSLQDALAIYAFLEMKLLLKRGHSSSSGITTSTIRSTADFVLTCNKTPVTLALAKRALECMTAFDPRTGGAAYPRVYVNALDCIAQVVERSGVETQCEDFLKILFKESQRLLSCKKGVGSLEERAIACFISRVLKAFPKVSIQWVNVLDQLLDSDDDVVRGLGIETISCLCEQGVFSIHSAYRVICKRIMPKFAVKDGTASPCTSDSWIRFQRLFISEDMTEEEAEALIERLAAARIECSQQDVPESAIEVQKTLYETLSTFPTEVVMHRIKEMECDRLGKSSALLAAAEMLIARVVREEMKLLKHKRAHAGGVSDAYANSLWSRTKRKVYSLGKRIAFNNAKTNSGEISFLAQMLWLASDARPSQSGLKHSMQAFAKLQQILDTGLLPSRVLNSFQMAETTWNAFITSWLYASDASGDLNDRMDMVSKMISDTLGKATNTEAERQAKAVLIGYTQIADEQAYQQIPSLLNSVRDEYSPLQAKVRGLFCLSLLIPGLMPHQDTLLSDIVATIISQFDRMDATDTKFHRHCCEVLGKTAFYLIKNKVPNSDPMVGSIVSKLLDGLGMSGKCSSLLLDRIEQSLPPRWCSRRELNSNSQDSQCAEIMYGAIVGLGWVARAALLAKEEPFYRAIQKAFTEYLSETTLQEIGQVAEFPYHAYSACLMVIPSLLSNAFGDESDSTFQAATLLLDCLNNCFGSCLNDNKHQNLLFPLAACIGSLVSILATLQIDNKQYSSDVVIEKSVKRIVGCVQDEKVPLNSRIGCAMAICNIFGCYMLTMPCFETYHKYVAKLPMESVGTKLVSDLLQCVDEVVSGNSEPLLKSVMSWCSQIIYYVMCNSQANAPVSKALRAGITFAKGSYIALCINKLEEYQNMAVSPRGLPKSLGNSAASILRCFKGVHDVDRFDTIQIACNTIAREVELEKDANMDILRASYDIIASHKNTKDCLVSEHVSALVKMFSSGQMDPAELTELFLSHLPSVLMLCAEENVRLVFKVLSKRHAASDTRLSIMTWKAVSSYIKVISARKPRRYKLLRDCIVAFAVESLHSHPAPTYWSAINTVFGKGSSFEDEHAWYSISECMSEWQISDVEFDYPEEVASKIPEEKTLLIILMVPNGKVALSDISSCQNLFMKMGAAQFRWMLPVLAMHTCDCIRNGKIDVKQWMLDIIDAMSSNLQDAATYQNGLSLFASVVLRCSSSNNISSDAAIWIQYDYSITMLPYSLPNVLKDLPKTFCSMFAHRFERAFATDLPILLPTLCSMKEHFSMKDSLSLSHTIEKICS